MRAITAGGAAAVDAEESLVATFQRMRPMDAVPGFTSRNVDGSIVVLVKELRGRTRSEHDLVDVNGRSGDGFIGEGPPGRP